MLNSNEWNDECFYCDLCNKAFRSPLYDVTKEYDYTIFFNELRTPEVEIMGAKVIANYCSKLCREKHRYQILKREKIQATFPDIGPVEKCSRCHGPVLMTSFHLTYVEMDTVQNWDQTIFGADVLNAKVISVVCKNCEPVPFNIARAIDWDS